MSKYFILFYLLSLLECLALFGIVWECVWKRYILLKTISKLDYMSNNLDYNLKSFISMSINVLPEINIFNFITHIIFNKFIKYDNTNNNYNNINIDNKDLINYITKTILEYMIYSSFIATCIFIFIFTILKMFQHVNILNKLRVKIINRLSLFIFSQSNKQSCYYSMN